MEPLLHFAIPFTLGSILRLGFGRGILLGILGILPDFDVFLYMHRSVSHSIVPSLTLALISLLLGGGWLRSILRLLALGLGSHVILDFIGGYTPVLWPISWNSYRLVFESRLYIGSFPTISIILNVLEKPYDYGVFTGFDASVFTGEGLLIAFLMMTSAILGKDRFRKDSH